MTTTKAKCKGDPLAVALADAPPLILPVRLSDGARRLGRGVVVSADGKVVAESPALAWAARIADALAAVGDTPPAALHAHDPRDTLVARTRAALAALVDALKGGVPEKKDYARRYAIERATHKAVGVLNAWEGKPEQSWQPQPPPFAGVLADPAHATPPDEPLPLLIPLPKTGDWPADLDAWELCSHRTDGPWLLRHPVYGATTRYDALNPAFAAARTLAATTCRSSTDQADAAFSFPEPPRIGPPQTRGTGRARRGRKRAA